MNHTVAWKHIYADVFRIKMRRKQMECYISKIEQCVKQNVMSLHPDTITQLQMLKYKRLPHICSCESWLCNYVVKIKTQCDANMTEFPYEQTQRWIREYVNTCLENFEFTSERKYDV